MMEMNFTKTFAEILKDGLALGVIVVDRQCRIVLWNAWLEKHSSLLEQNVLGKSIFEVFPDIDRRGKAKFLVQCIERAKPALLSPLVHRFFVPLDIVRSGRTVTMLQNTRIYPLMSDGACEGAIIIIEDMTESILDEQEIVRLNRVLAGIRNINQLITRVDDEIAVLSEACAILADHVGYDVVMIAAVEGEKLNLVAVDGKDLSTELVQEAYAHWKTEDCCAGVTLEVLETGMLKVMDPIEPQSLCSVMSKLSSTLHCQAMCALPLKSKSEVLGIMTIFSSKPGLFVGDELSLLYEVASDLGFSLHALRERNRRRKAEEQVKEAYSFTRAVLASSPVGIMTFDREGKCLSANEAASRIFDIPMEQLCEKCLQDLFVGSSEEFRRDYEEVLSSGVRKTCETLLHLKDGRARWFSIHMSRVIVASMANVMILLEDITDRKHSLDALVRSERLKAIGELSAGVSHNFNNLLQIIMSAAQMSQIDMELGKMPSVAQNLQRIVTACQQGSATVRRLQRFTTPDKDDAAQKKVLDLSQIVSDAVEMTKVWWKTLPEKDGVKIDLITHLVPGCYVPGSESELFEVVVNLIKNAVEAIPEGGEIQIRTFSDEDEVILQVIDNGVGIAEENVGKIFEPFFTTKGVQRSGLGLSSSYGIVQNHKGTIEVSSKEGLGTHVMVKLPSAYPRTPIQADEIPVKSTKKKLHIIAVDDLEPLVDIMQKGLEMWGHKVATALSAEEALQLYDLHKTDLIITDLAMPGMTGWELAKKIKELSSAAGVKKPAIIMLTGWEDAAYDTNELENSGVDAVLTKPLRMEELLGKISEFFPSEERAAS
jgi:PAS domain S-box-containing protein